MIKKINLARLTAAEFYQFFALLLNIADTANPTTIKIKLQRDAFAAIVARLQAALNNEQAYALTAILEALDMRRDTAITGFVMWVRSLTMHPKQPVRDAAKALQTYLKTHGNNIAQQNLQTETAVLTKVADDCKTVTSLKQAITDLKGEEWLAEIEAANNEYIAKYQLRSTEMGVNANAESFSTVRRVAVTCYYSLLDIIETRYKAAKADGTDATASQKCIDDMNATIVQYKQLILATQARKKEEPQPEEKK